MKPEWAKNVYVFKVLNYFITFYYISYQGCKLLTFWELISFIFHKMTMILVSYHFNCLIEGNKNLLFLKTSKYKSLKRSYFVDIFTEYMQTIVNSLITLKKKVLLNLWTSVTGQIRTKWLKLTAHTILILISIHVRPRSDLTRIEVTLLFPLYMFTCSKMTHNVVWNSSRKYI